jgi:hypothetical protein
MSDVFDKQRMMLLPSVNTPDFMDEARYIISPDMEAVKDVDRKYLKIDGSRVVEMSTAEKAAVDATVVKPVGFPCPYGHQEGCPYAPKL